MEVTKTLKFRLNATETDRLSLYRTLQEYNKALNTIAYIAFTRCTFSRYRLYYLSYHEVRSSSSLPARLVCEAIRQVAWAYANKKRRGQLVSFTSNSFHLHRTAFKLKDGIASISTIDGRVAIPVSTSKYHNAFSDWLHREARITLDLRHGRAYLDLTMKKDIERINTTDVIGVDIGQNNLATCSTGLNFKGGMAKSTRGHYSKVRQDLQAKGTRSAKRRIKAIGRRENGILNWMLHNISRRIVDHATERHSAIALEDLTHIRDRTRVRHDRRREHHSWAFARLQSFICYKAAEEGIPIIWVDPAYTSKTCSQCGERGQRTGLHFHCPSCGYSMDADRNASFNIRARGQGLLSWVPAGEPHDRDSSMVEVLSVT